MLSTAGVNQLAGLAEAGEISEEVPLLIKVIRELAPVLAIAVTLLPVLEGLYYRQMNFLSFLHSVTEPWVMAVFIVSAAVIALAVSRASFRAMRLAWNSMEIK